ncbi:DUF4190 domain-containing protein [Jeotgalibacillus aurantiacus]|uniref:DUF4190 domain-containing protein n=1 Tax=Jeotgalibacillus aurantiacus TaxID=2763266 RepID=UPI001D0B7E7D|nr:DUF4190 domain-containing protein [Jeotgalibacillus aurantiacus]
MDNDKMEKKDEKSLQENRYDEEMGSELSRVSPAWYTETPDDTERKRDGVIKNTNRGMWLGYASIITGIIAFFTAPVLFGALAIILGFAARRSDGKMSGGAGIVLGAISIVLGLLIYPLF